MKHLWAYGACLLVAALIAAPSASAMPFHRGDVFVHGTQGIEEYSPDGTPQQLIEGTSWGGFFEGEGGFCFDPSGNYLIVPGAGLFDKQGRMLASNWASDIPGGDCVVDALGDVLVPSAYQTITKYDIQGNLLQSFMLQTYHSAGPDVTLAIALGPDECTMYYGVTGGLIETSIGRYNVCTNTQESPFGRAFDFQELRVLPNWEVLSLDDRNAELWAGRRYRPPDPPYPRAETQLRYMALDSDGTSFWMCCEGAPGPGGDLLRFDINTGELLAHWKPIRNPHGLVAVPIAVYSPDNNGRGAG